MSGSDGDSVKSAKTALKMVDGDWICGDPDCKNLNFARRTHCNRCNKERILDAAARKKLGVEIGKAAAEKSRGLFSAEDWQCNKCANVNWARRNTCNMCNAPKITDVEERTGYGGGYNDRGVVEYKERAEVSDGEYDEFGRRKKKREERHSASSRKKDERISESRTSTPNSSKHGSTNKIDTNDKPESASEKEDDDDDDDDDEEDGDDADLSKYDLWGSDDEKKADNESTNNSVAKVNDKRSSQVERKLSRSRPSPSRSRSRSCSSSSSASSTSTSSSSSRSRSSSSRSTSRRSRLYSRNRSGDRNRHNSQSDSRSNRSSSRRSYRSRSRSQNRRSRSPLKLLYASKHRR